MKLYLLSMLSLGGSLFATPATYQLEKLQASSLKRLEETNTQENAVDPTRSVRFFTVETGVIIDLNRYKTGYAPMVDFLFLIEVL